MKRNLWPGMIIGRMNNEKGANETPGHIHFSMKTFMRDSSIISQALKQGPYRKAALVPPSPWLDAKAPEIPVIDPSIADDSLRLSWSHQDPTDVFQTVVYFKYGKNWEYTILLEDERTKMLPLMRIVRESVSGRQEQDKPKEIIEKLNHVTVTAVDRLGNESWHAFWAVPSGQ